MFGLQDHFNHRRAFTKAIKESTSLFSDGYLMGREECLGKKSIVGKLLNCNSCCANGFCSPSALNFPTFTPLPASFSANSTYDPSIAWQKGHQGAYRTTSQGSRRSSAFNRFSIPLLLNATTLWVSKISATVADPLAWTAPLPFPLTCPAFSSLMFPLWRPQQQQQQHQSANFKLTRPPPEVRRYPPGFLSTPSNTGNRSFERNVDKDKRNFVELRDTRFAANIEDKRDNRLSTESRKIFGDMIAERKLSSQLDSPGPPTGSNLPSVSASDVEESMSELNDEIGENVGKTRYRLQADMSRVSSTVRREFDDSHELLINALVLEDQPNKNKDQKSSRYKEHRLDTRGQRLLGQRMRIFKRQIECRRDIDRLNAPFLAIYESLIPPEEEKAKQKQLLTLLEKLVWTEWPEARLYIYGSCANSFGVSKSDIDICLTIEDPDVNKSEVLLKLADILESDNLQNVQALTRARVPIVKLKDPVTGISCDICVNNILAVVNTKLLSDYAQIDERLRQLAFIVKHWAKSRGVNETYHGTLSSYAYVLMCIHLLQQRKPAILPCLQGMERTYAVTVENIECAYFDQVEKLSGFGLHNGESIAQLVWAFFNYWAYCHDYTNDVISIRTGTVLSKRAKDWTRRVGFDRHLICIEDPFEITHDLGRVVDKYSIKVVREEFERAAKIMQNDPDPCVRLFEPYVRS